MNILFIHDHEVNPFKGGMQRVTYLLAQEFARRGHSSLFLSLREDPQEFTGKGTFPQITLPAKKLGKETFNQEIARIIGEQSIGLIILQHPEPPYWDFIEGLSSLAPTYFFLHNQPYPLVKKERFVKRLTPASSLRPKGRILRLLGIITPGIFRKLYLSQFGKSFKKLVDAVNKMVLLSDHYVPRFIQYTPGIDKKKVMALNNPITFPIENISIDFSRKENIVLVVCRMTNPQKNLTGFIDVWKDFSNRKPDWKAIIVGDGESRQLVEKYARKTGVARLQFEGNRENVRDYYKKAKIFCMTSSYEGWPMTLMESMAFGCVPVVYDSFEAVQEMITSGKDGIIVPAFNKKKMVEGMSDLADNPEKLQKLASAAHEKLELYTCDKIVDIWEKKIFSQLTP